ncbi:MAG: cell division protein FtsQ [Bacteroidaceae bacterium]|jgi:cell division protein FtsQ|nr:cell division protein FtsQ [Bacteroidaceae bacterium]
MKIALKIILLLLVAGYLIFAIVRFSQRTEERVCEAVDIQIEDSLEGGFVTADYIHNILTKNKVFAEGQKLSSIDIQGLEEKLQKDPYIDSARCYCSAASHLCIQIFPQRPILHIAQNNGENYYLDGSGTIMPIENMNIDLCVATGNITKDYAKKNLIELAKYIHKDDFWDKQIEQIHVTDNHEIELYPRVGEHVIILGTVENFKKKLDKLMIFYKNGLSKTGWNKYSIINLSFDGQIVCTKKNNTKKI